jgi:restriction system protein
VEHQAKTIRIAAGQARVDSQNAELNRRISELLSIGTSSLQGLSAFSFEGLRREFTPEVFDAAKACGPQPLDPRLEDFRTHIASPGWMSRLFGAQSRYEWRLQNAKERDQIRFKEAERAYADALEKWRWEVKTATEKHEREQDAKRLEIEENNARIDRIQSAFLTSDEASVAEYFSLALAYSDYPKEFPRQFSIEYQRRTKSLTIKHTLPGKDIVPQVSSYRYLKTTNEIREKRRSTKQIAEIYSQVMSAFALQAIYEVFSADPNGTVQVANFCGYAGTVNDDDQGTSGSQIISLRVAQKDYLG